MSEDIRRCKFCGRIIIDKNNITGLCPKHQKCLNDSAAVVGIGVVAWTLKKLVLKFWKDQLNLLSVKT